MKFFNPLLCDLTPEERENHGFQITGTNGITGEKANVACTLDQPKKNKMRRYAIVFGYLGTGKKMLKEATVQIPIHQDAQNQYSLIFLGFHGMQKQKTSSETHIPTVEQALEKALIECNLMDPDAVKKKRKIHWSRAARTDKGVHAVSQLIAVELRFPDTPHQAPSSEQQKDETPQPIESDSFQKHYDQEGHMKNLLQTQLNKDGYRDTIRLFTIYRVTKLFDARLQCSYRSYQYILPFFALSPASLTCAGRSHPGYHYFFSTQYESEVSELNPTTDVDAPSRIEHSTEEITLMQPADLLKDDSDSLEFTGMSKSPTYATFQSENQLDKTELHKKSQDIFTRLVELLSQYKGSHNYHNFTPGGNPNNPAMMRFIKTIDVEIDWWTDSQPMFIINIKGQSFLLNQIRKMIGLVVQIIRGTAPENAILKCLTKTHKYSIHTAPATGLLLNSVFYDMYNQYRAKQAMAPQINVQDLSMALSNFRKNVIYPAVYEELTINDNQPWTNMEKILASYPFFVINFPPQICQATNDIPFEKRSSTKKRFRK